jgi:hypothetical protein
MVFTMYTPLDLLCICARLVAGARDGLQLVACSGRRVVVLVVTMATVMVTMAMTMVITMS